MENEIVKDYLNECEQYIRAIIDMETETNNYRKEADALQKKYKVVFDKLFDTVSLQKLKVTDKMNQVLEGISIAELVDSGMFVLIVVSSKYVDLAPTSSSGNLINDIMAGETDSLNQALTMKSLERDLSMSSKLNTLMANEGFAVHISSEDLETKKVTFEIEVLPNATEKTYHIISNILHESHPAVRQQITDFMVFFTLKVDDTKQSRLEMHYNHDAVLEDSTIYTVDVAPVFDFSNVKSLADIDPVEFLSSLAGTTQNHREFFDVSEFYDFATIVESDTVSQLRMFASMADTLRNDR